MADPRYGGPFLFNCHTGRLARPRYIAAISGGHVRANACVEYFGIRISGLAAKRKAADAD